MISKETSGMVLKNTHHSTFSILTRRDMWRVFHGVVIKINTTKKL
jgi:hypothetical protein